MSGRVDQQTRQIMCKARPIANRFKPFDEKSLLGAIRKALHKHGLNAPSASRRAMRT